jgi:hypothetical protein
MSEIPSQPNKHALDEAHIHQHPSARLPEHLPAATDNDGWFSGSEAQSLPSSENKIKPSLVGAGELALAFGNAVVSVPEFAVAVARKAGVAAMDSLHNWFDFLGYLKQLRLIAMSSPENQKTFNTDSRFKMWSDVKKWFTQANADDEAKLEKSSFALISLPAIGAAALAGVGLINELAGSSEDDVAGLADIAHLGAASAALALAGGLMHAGSRMVRKAAQADNPHPNLIRHTNNFYTHAKLDAASSGAAVAESLVHIGGNGIWAINAGVLAISGYQVWRFWPSRAGKQAPHVHEHEDEDEHEHEGHQHGSCSHAHVISHETIDFVAVGLRKIKMMGGAAMRGFGAMSERGKSLFKPGHRRPASPEQRQARKQERQGTLSRLRLAAGVGTMALAVVGGLLSGETQNKDTVPLVPDTTSSPATHTQPEYPITPPVPKSPKPTTECATVKPGDSQWKIVERHIGEATGKYPSASATNAITMFTAIKNMVDHPQPDTIHAGDCLRVPTYEALQVLNRAIEQPQVSDPQLVTDLKTFNQRRTLQEVLASVTESVRVDSYLQKSLGG